MDLNYISKFKILLNISRWYPLVFAICTFMSIILQFNGYYLEFLIKSSVISWLVLIYLYIISYALSFCFYHRLSLHYILISQLLCYIDQKIGLPLDLTELFILHITLFLILIISLIYFKATHKNGQPFYICINVQEKVVNTSKEDVKQLKIGIFIALLNMKIIFI